MAGVTVHTSGFRGAGWLRPLAAALAGIVVGALAVLFGPAQPASAHAVLLSTSPAKGAVLSTAPAQVVLTFSESVRVVPGKVRVIGPDGKQVSEGEPSVTGADLVIPVRQDGAGRGTYLVNYRVVSADSHPIAGGFTYSVGAPSATPPAEEQGATVDPVVQFLVAAARYLGYAGLVLVIGPVLVLTLLWPRRLSRAGPGRLIWIGLGLIGVSTVASLLLQDPYTTGTSLGGSTAAGLRDVLGSQFGTALLIRLGVLAATAFLIRPLVNGEGGRSDQTLLAILAVIGLGTWPLAGHPAASPLPAVSVVVDAVHLASMAVWLGGLVMLVGFLLRWADERELGAILPIWSRWAATAVAALVLAGSVQALIEIGTLGAVLSTTYGRLILFKVGLLAAVIAVAAYSRSLVRKRVAAGRPAAMRRAVLVELGITAVVLGLSAALVQTTPGRTAEENTAAAEGGAYSATLTTELYALQVDVAPARTGNNSVHLYAYDSAGNPKKVVEWKATAALPAAGVEPVDVPLLKITDNHAIGDISLPTAGQWQFRFTLRTSDIDQATVTATVSVT